MHNLFPFEASNWKGFMTLILINFVLLFVYALAVCLAVKVVF